jgi:hypothetical protein
MIQNKKKIKIKFERKKFKRDEIKNQQIKKLFLNF